LLSASGLARCLSLYLFMTAYIAPGMPRWGAAFHRGQYARRVCSGARATVLERAENGMLVCSQLFPDVRRAAGSFLSAYFAPRQLYWPGRTVCFNLFMIEGLVFDPTAIMACSSGLRGFARSTYFCTWGGDCRGSGRSDRNWCRSRHRSSVQAGAAQPSADTYGAQYAYNEYALHNSFQFWRGALVAFLFFSHGCRLPPRHRTPTRYSWRAGRLGAGSC